MQRIEHLYIHKLKTLCQVELLYTKLSDYNHTSLRVSDIFRKLLNKFKENVYVELPKTYHVEFTPVEVAKWQPVMIVCCSGGKDSVATALHYKNQGYNVILYHMKGINVSYYDEHTVIPEIADYLGCIYYIDEIKLSGKHQYVEHPMKNMLIANGAIQFCIDNNLPVNISFGNYRTSKLDEMEFDIDAGDSRDMWNIYEDIIRHEIPDFKIYTPLESIEDTFHALMYEDTLDLFSKCISCMSPYRFRKHWAERTEKKYGIKLMPHRCGCCYKCCLEYIVLVDYEYIPCNQTYYDHCFEILKNTARKETGVEDMTNKEVWDKYIWYDISNSHFKNLENF